MTFASASSAMATVNKRSPSPRLRAPRSKLRTEIVTRRPFTSRNPRHCGPDVPIIAGPDVSSKRANTPARSVIVDTSDRFTGSPSPAKSPRPASLSRNAANASSLSVKLAVSSSPNWTVIKPSRAGITAASLDSKAQPAITENPRRASLAPWSMQ